MIRVATSLLFVLAVAACGSTATTPDPSAGFIKNGKVIFSDNTARLVAVTDTTTGLTCVVKQYWQGGAQQWATSTTQCFGPGQSVDPNAVH